MFWARITRALRLTPRAIENENVVDDEKDCLSIERHSRAVG
jgi:hypothetical protein